LHGNDMSRVMPRFREQVFLLRYRQQNDMTRPRSRCQMRDRSALILGQFGFGVAASIAGLVVMAALFRIAVFDSSLYPGLVLWSQVMGGVALLLTPWTVSALGRWQWLVVVSIVLGGVGLGLGLYIAALAGST